MAAEEIAAFLTTFIFCLATVSMFLALYLKRKAAALFAVISIMLMVGMLALFISQPQSILLTDLVMNGLREHPMPTVLALLCGIAAVVPWFMVLFWIEQLETSAARVIAQAMCVCTLMGFCGGFSVFLFDETYDIKVIDARVLVPGFQVEELALLEVDPVALAVDEKNNVVYVSYHNGELNGVYDGGIYRIDLKQGEGTPIRPELAVSSPVLYRSFGLTFHQGDLYVSRSGVHATAKNGKIHNENLGVITRLSDLDGDGLFEFFHDVLSGIPGARGPDPQHQNNGIVFDQNGNLFVAVGTNDDRSLDEHPWGGAILKASPDFQNVEVFANGFRNPFSITIGPNDSVFATDNDVRSDAGDEVNHIQFGRHYGHPFVVGKPESSPANGFEAPIYVADPHSNLNGVAYADSEAFPEVCRGCVFVTNRPGNHVMMLRMQENEGRLEVAEEVFFAKILNPIDIHCTKSGEIYVLSRVYRRLYRIRPM